MWTRVKKLGMGGFAVVFLAIASPSSFNLPPVMAVKSAPVLQSRSLRREIAFLNEFRSCPSVLGCFGDEFTVERGVPLYNIFLEYAAGGSLGDRIRSSGVGLPEIDVKRYVKSVLKGLRGIHNRGFVHCDIKPDNILLVVEESDSDSLIPSSSSSSSALNRNKRKRVEGSTAKIADFGLAKRAGERLKSRAGKGKLGGTALYMAPESIVNGEYEPESDIWALGCTVLELLTGTEPWKFDPNAGTEAFLNAIGFTEQLPEIPVGLSEESQDFLRKCLARDPMTRWTADMLLHHSFVCPLDFRVTGRDRDRNRVVVPRAAKALRDSSTRSEFDVLKPNLIMSHLASDGIVPCWLNSCITTKHSGIIVSEEFPACKKRRVEKEDAEQDYISDIPTSSTGIEIFN